MPAQKGTKMLGTRLGAYNRRARSEGYVTGQREADPNGPLPTDIDDRLNNPAYTARYPQATSGFLRGARRRVSDKELAAGRAKEKRLEAYIKAHPNEPLPANWDGNSKAKGGKISAAEAVHKHERKMHKGKPLTKLAKGGSTASKRADGCCTKGKTKGRMV